MSRAMLRPLRRTTLRRWAPAIVLAIAFALVSVAVVPEMKADGSAREVVYDLGAGEPAPCLRLGGDAELNVDGVVVPSLREASAVFTVTPPALRPGERAKLVVTAGADGAGTTLIVGTGAARQTFGPFEGREVRRIDVTAAVRDGGLRVRVGARNFTVTPRLFADQVRAVAEPPEAAPAASRWAVAAWALLGAALCLAAAGRLRDYALLPAALGLTALLVWPDVTGEALEPLQSDLWEPAVDASWLGLHDGLVSGTFGHRSGLAVQLFHAVTPVTGEGVAGARAASLLVGLAAVAAIFVLGHRVAGTLGAVVAVGCALATDTFRLSLSSGDATSTLVLAGCLLLLAVHRALQGADARAMAWLGAAGGVAILAEPTWWPGIVAGVVLVALRHAPQGAARRALATGLLVLVVVSLPSRVSVADQYDGDLNGDIAERATRARNFEFVGRGHGAPPDEEARVADPAGGPKVGLVEYVLGDHSVTVAAGGTLTGATDSLSAAAERPETKLIGLLAFLVQIAGVMYLLLVPWLRPLVLIPALAALVSWFFASREVVPAFAAGAVFWPVLLAGAAVLAYAVRQFLRTRGSPGNRA